MSEALQVELGHLSTDLHKQAQIHIQQRRVPSIYDRIAPSRTRNRPHPYVRPNPAPLVPPTVSTTSIPLPPFPTSSTSSSRAAAQNTLKDQFHASPGFRLIRMAYELFSILDRSGFERSPSQKEVHDVYMAMVSPFLFLGDFERYKSEILAMFRLAFIPWLKLLKWGRRNGKSFSLWEFVSIVIYVSPGINILIYTLNESLIRDVMTEIKSFFALLPHSLDRIVVSNKDTFGVSRMQSGGTSGATGSHRAQQQQQLLNFVRVRVPKEDQKGIKANVVICDEAGGESFTRRFYADVISVLAKVANTVFILASTVDQRLQSAPGGTVFGNLCMRDPSTGALKHPEMMLSEVIMICNDCKKQDSLRFETCPHYEYKHPHWNLSMNTDRAKVLMDGDLESFGTDVQGLGAESKSDTALPPHDIHALETSSPVCIDETHMIEFEGGFLMTYLDPAGGGPHSETAILTLYVVPFPREDHFFVVGIDSANLLSNRDAEKRCFGYFGKMQEHPLFSNLPHFLMVEANYGGCIFSSQWAQWCKTAYPNLIEVDQNSDKGSGVVLSQGLKMAAWMEAKAVLSSSRFHFASKLVTIEKTKQPYLMAQMIDQLRNLQAVQVIRERKTSKVSIRGKSVSSHAKDDLAIAWLVMVGFYKDFIRRRRPQLNSRAS